MLPRLNVGFGKYLFKAGKTWQLLPELGLDMTTDGKRNTLISGKTISIDPHLGLEASYKKTLFFRIGVGNIQKVKDDNDTTNQKQYTIFQPSLGIGLKIDKLVIDYAFTSLQTQSNPLLTHIVSLRLLFDKPKSSATKTEMKPTTISNP